MLEATVKTVIVIKTTIAVTETIRLFISLFTLTLFCPNGSAESVTYFGARFLSLHFGQYNFPHRITPS